jgi:hypothetical protein
MLSVPTLSALAPVALKRQLNSLSERSGRVEAGKSAVMRDPHILRGYEHVPPDPQRLHDIDQAFQGVGEYGDYAPQLYRASECDQGI